jgi:hypothetical protein
MVWGGRSESEVMELVEILKIGLSSRSSFLVWLKEEERMRERIVINQREGLVPG